MWTRRLTLLAALAAATTLLVVLQPPVDAGAEGLDWRGFRVATLEDARGGPLAVGALELGATAAPRPVVAEYSWRLGDGPWEPLPADGLAPRVVPGAEGGPPELDGFGDLGREGRVEVPAEAFRDATVRFSWSLFAGEGAALDVTWSRGAASVGARSAIAPWPSGGGAKRSLPGRARSEVVGERVVRTERVELEDGTRLELRIALEAPGG